MKCPPTRPFEGVGAPPPTPPAALRAALPPWGRERERPAPRAAEPPTKS